jgi:predicted RecA/RadA family phage recombinase
MTTTFRGDGNVVTISATGYSSGDPVVEGQLVGVAVADSTSGGETAVSVKGVHALTVYGVDDDGSNAVEMGNLLTINKYDTNEISKKKSGVPFGIALEAVSRGSTATIEVMLTQPAAAFGDFHETFNSAPLATLATGGAVSGDEEAVNLLTFDGGNVIEMYNIGTQSILAPTITAGGADISRDQTDGDGSEFTRGITSQSPQAFTVGTDAFYCRVVASIEDVSGADTFLAGFRKAAAYTADFNDYTDLAGLNVEGGNIKTETILNNGATTTTDTTDDWADEATHVLEVFVSTAGAVSYKIDGASPTTQATTTFSFDSGDTVVPCLIFEHGSDVAGEVIMKEWTVGKQR